MKQQNTKTHTQTMQFIDQHTLADTPIIYTVCYEYFLGNYPLLNQDINKTLEDKTEITSEVMQHWFDTYLIDYELTDFNQAQLDLNKIVTELELTTSEAEGNISQFNHSLRECKNELRTTTTDTYLTSIASHLINSSNSMQAVMDQMKQQLTSCKQEISSLHKRLETTNIETLTPSLTEATNRKDSAIAVKETLSTREFSSTDTTSGLLNLDIDHLWQ